MRIEAGVLVLDAVSTGRGVSRSLDELPWRLGCDGSPEESRTSSPRDPAAVEYRL